MDLDEALAAVQAGHADVPARREAAWWLWRRTRDPADDLAAATGALDAALDDDDPVVRGHAVAALGDLLFATRSPGDAIPELDGVLALLTDDDDRVRQSATGVLWSREWLHDVGADDHPITASQRERAAVGLVACLDADRPLVRARAAAELRPPLVLAHPDPERAMATLAAALDDRPDVRSNAAELLADAAAERPALLDPHVDRLRQAMLDDEATRAAAADGLAALIDRFPDLAAPVADVLLAADPDPFARRAPRRITTLGEILLARPDGFERSDAVLAELQSTLADGFYKVRLAAAKALQRLARQSPAVVDPAQPLLSERLHDESEHVRRHAACALAELVDPADAGPALATLAATYRDRDVDDPGPDPLVHLADARPAFVCDRLERLRAATPNPRHDVRLTVAEILSIAPAAAHPFLDGCAADLDADDPEVRNGAAWLVGQAVLDNPDEGAAYARPLLDAVRSPDDFDEYAHRKVRTALAALAEAADPSLAVSPDRIRTVLDRVDGDDG
ncbi:MAG: HEAT repeat domain-containing protein [Haloplanus sp.]